MTARNVLNFGSTDLFKPCGIAGDGFFHHVGADFGTASLEFEVNGRFELLDEGCGNFKRHCGFPFTKQRGFRMLRKGYPHKRCGHFLSFYTRSVTPFRVVRQARRLSAAITITDTESQSQALVFRISLLVECLASFHGCCMAGVVVLGERLCELRIHAEIGQFRLRLRRRLVETLLLPPPIISSSEIARPIFAIAFTTAG